MQQQAYVDRSSDRWDRATEQPPRLRLVEDGHVAAGAPGPTPGAPQPWWTVDLDDGYGGVVTLEAKIKMDVVELWLATRAVAIVDRDVLAAWLDEPVGTFERHDVSLWWSELGPALEVLGRTGPTLVDPASIADLRRRLARS